ncbi:MAG TPA: type II secretion system protein [Usitatibacter sp.]|nr:type II secretion system protein [Usitatibacter sp.]
MEIMVALLIMTVLAAGLTIPLAAQLQIRRTEETRRVLEEARDALLGFAVAHGRLPCPALPETRGQEAFAPGGDATNGACASFHGGLLPAAALGLAPLDAEGFARDPYGTSANRIRYAVFGASAVNGVAHVLTRRNGMQSATLAGLGGAPHYLFICASGALADGTGCGPPANQLTRRAAFVLLSAGANAHQAPTPGGDESRNLDADPVFVSREASTVPGREFDDLVHWTAIHLLVNRMVAAHRLP